MSHVLQGVVRDGKIELINGPDLEEGQLVRVMIEFETGRVPAVDAGLFPEEGVVHTPASPALRALLDQVRRTLLPLRPGPTGAGRKSAAGMLANDPTWDEHAREVFESRKSAEYREIAE